MAPYTPYDPYEDMSDIESEYDSESETIRMSAKEMCTPMKCEYCSNQFHERCWEHSWDDEWGNELECDTIYAHHCTHSYMCAACKNQYVTQEELYEHRCSKNYQCKVCLKRCKDIEEVNLGNHDLRRSHYGIRRTYGRIVNCNDFYVRVTASGLRVIVQKDDPETCSKEIKKAKEKARIAWLIKHDYCPSGDSSDESVSDDSDVLKQDFSSTSQAENAAKEENENKRKREDSGDESDEKQNTCSKRFRTWLD